VLGEYDPSRRRPSFEGAADLVLREKVPPDHFQGLFINPQNSYLRVYDINGCSVIVTKGYGKWHMSVAHPTRYPLWDEVAAARYGAVPEGVTMAMLLPPRDKYINNHKYCFQLVEVVSAGPMSWETK
jgi:hypothetical protein